jgi:hypothetical protein
MRDNGRDKEVLKFMLDEGKTSNEIYTKFHDIMNNTIYSMLKRFIRDGQVVAAPDAATKGGRNNAQALLRYTTLEVPITQLPKLPGFYTKPWGRLPSKHSIAMAEDS